MVAGMLASEVDGLRVAFDLETTGLSSRTDRIIEVGAVKFDAGGDVIDRYATLADPGVPVPLVVQRLCGLHDSDLQGAPAPEEVVAQLADFCRDCLLVGHGISFDLAFCAEILPDQFLRRRAVDTAELARTVLPVAPSHSLEELARMLDIGHDRPHRAFSDADATRLLLTTLLEQAQQLPAALRRRIRQLCAGSGWVTGEFLAAELSKVGEPAAAATRQGGPAPAAVPPALPQEPVARSRRLDAVWVGEQFGPGGALAAVNHDFELREEQQQMAVAVAQAFNRDETLLVEAGTGVGKSLAYLLPAREWAARTGERVVVSTHTITLQEQLLGSDLRALEAARPLPVRAAVLKGRGNYLSLRRLERWLASSAPGRRGAVDEVRFQVRALIWAHQTEHGDRAELRLAGRDAELWDRVASTVDDCLGPACQNWQAARCFMVRARLAAREADVLVVNHALLLTDADSGGAVLPEFRRLVVDEAHHLEEAATRALARRVAAGSVLSITDRLPAFADAPLNDALRAARNAAQTAFGDLRAGLASEEGINQLPFDRRLWERDWWRRASKSLRRMVAAVGEAAEQLRAVAERGGGQGSLWPQPRNASRECWVAADAMTSVGRAIGRVLEHSQAEQPDPAEVAWMELERGDRLVACLAPVEVGPALRERLLQHCDTAVLTSATLAVAGSFRYARERLGLLDTEELVLDSPFDYLHQSLCCLPRGIPSHTEPEHAAVVAEMVVAIARELGGRTLMLFTGYVALREMHALLRSRLGAEGIAVMGQGLDGTRNQLLRNFRQNPRTVLLGTNTFWEGIDLPGEDLQCVVIDKLPFPVPSDPLYQARARRTQDSFAELALPEAVLRLKQGFGRLVRRRGDRGAVVICDPRIVERSYGESFVNALPRAQFLYEPAGEVARAVGAFLRGAEGEALVG